MGSSADSGMTTEGEQRLPSDLRILAAYVRHDSKQIHRIAEHLRRYLAVIANRFPNVGTDDDLIHDAIVKVIEQCKPHFKPEKHGFLSWAGTVARRLYIDMARKLPRDAVRFASALHGKQDDDQPLPVAAPSPSPDPEDMVAQCLAILMAAEPDSQKRDAFRMRHLDGLDWDALAGLFEKARKTVQGWVTETHKRLEDYCRAQGIELADLRE